MKQEIKDRIEQINNGKVPEGYKKSPIGVVPIDWEDICFSDLFFDYSEYTEDFKTFPLYTLSIEDGIISKPERYEREHLVKKENAYKVLPSNYYAYNPMNARFGAIARNKNKYSVAVSGYYDIFTTNEKSDLLFMDSFLISPKMITYYNRMATGSLIEKQRVHFSQFLQFVLPMPTLSERKRIAEILSAQDKVIDLKEKLIEQKRMILSNYTKRILQGKKTNTYSPWNDIFLKDALDYLQPTYYLVKNTEYSNDYNTPVLTAGKSFILGYTDEKEGIFDDVPVIIFDDFTTDIKYVDFPFKAKSSAMKILKARNGYDIRFLYYVLTQINYIVGGHERHWISKFSHLKVLCPPYKDQLKIAHTLDTFYKEIKLLEQDLEQEKQKKKALMQLLLTGIVRVK